MSPSTSKSPAIYASPMLSSEGDSNSLWNASGLQSTNVNLGVVQRSPSGAVPEPNLKTLISVVCEHLVKGLRNDRMLKCLNGVRNRPIGTFTLRPRPPRGWLSNSSVLWTARRYYESSTCLFGCTGNYVYGTTTHPGEFAPVSRSGGGRRARRIPRLKLRDDVQIRCQIHVDQLGMRA